MPDQDSQFQGLQTRLEPARRIDAAFEPSGEVSDRASPELAAARERSRGLHKQLKGRIEDLLGDLENEE